MFDATNGRQPAAIATLAASIFTLSAATPALSTTLPHPAGIVITAKLPESGGALPLFKLQPTSGPAAFVNDALRAGHGPALAFEGNVLAARDAAGTLQAFVDPARGDAEIFPDLTASRGAAQSTAAATRVAAGVFARADIIPGDATRIRIGDATPVLKATVRKGPDGATQRESAPQQLFTYVSASRYAAGLPVVGSGSQATVAVGNDGSIRGLVRHWQAATVAGSLKSALDSSALVRAIDAQLQPLVNATTVAVVDNVSVAYYDGNGKYLQPVYEFDATLRPVGRGLVTDHVRGYVPFGKLLEPIPILGRSSGQPAPSAPHPATAKLGTNLSYISLGEYANRDGTMQDQANAYLNGFDSVTPGSYGPPISRRQWYWAYPNQVESSANSYLNAMQVAYTMPHGDWYLNTTLSNNADLWYVNQIGVGGNPGYGAASGGHLATWIIDSCEVVPSYYDLQFTTGNGNNAFNYWWPVFQGLHRVLGFRTQMLLGEDTMNYDIAYDMARGANANSAFFNTVAGFSFPTYQDAHLKNTWVHYDRASMMYDPRNANESIYAVKGQTASGQLTNVWMGN